MSSASSGRRRVVVTGIAGRFGRTLIRRLHRLEHYEVIGIDTRAIGDLPKDIEHLRIDLRSRRALEVFKSGDVYGLVHIGLRHSFRQTDQERQHLWNIVGTSQLLESCLEHGVSKVVVLSSASLYGPRSGNDQYLREDAPLLGAMDFPQIRDLVEVDMQAQSFFWRARDSATETVILRPVHILGHAHNAPSNYLRLKRVPVLLGFDPMVQVIHELDVVEALLLALEPGAHGIYNINGPTEVPLSELVRETGKPRVVLPYTAFRLGLQALWASRLTTFPVPELTHIRFGAMVDGSRARDELGYSPRYSLREAVQAALAGSEPERELAATR